MPPGGLIIIGFGKNHPAGRSLQDFGDGHIDLFIQELLTVFDHYHGTIVHIADALIEFLAFLDHLNLKTLARQQNDLDSVGKIIDV